MSFGRAEMVGGRNVYATLGSGGGGGGGGGGAQDESVRIWDPVEGKCLQTLTAPGQCLNVIKLHVFEGEDGSGRVVAGDVKGNVCAWAIGDRMY
jgi:hypothetical protein